MSEENRNLFNAELAFDIEKWADTPVRFSDFLRTFGPLELPAAFHGIAASTPVLRTAWIQRHAIDGLYPPGSGCEAAATWRHRRMRFVFAATSPYLQNWISSPTHTRVLGVKGRWWFREGATDFERAAGFRVVRDPFAGLVWEN